MDKTLIMAGVPKSLPNWGLPLLLITCGFFVFSCKESHNPDASFIPHPDNASKKIEYYIKKPKGSGAHPAIIFIHGHQTGLQLPGGRDFADWGVLEKFSNLGFVAIAISQPGYGASDGPPDYCGSFTQNAVIAVIEKFEKEGIIQSNQIILEGISRGAIVAGLVAAKKQSIRGLILISGVFDFTRYQEEAKTNAAKRSIINAIQNEIGKSDDSLFKRSVLLFADRIKASTLILNGENDDKTIPQQARGLADEINKHGGNASFVVFKNTGHLIPVNQRDKIIDSFISNTVGNKKIE